MGSIILWKALREVAASPHKPRRVKLLGLFGGFLDAIGGGWGPERHRGRKRPAPADRRLAAARMAC
jgi:hypothetical protein